MIELNGKTINGETVNDYTNAIPPDLVDTIVKKQRLDPSFSFSVGMNALELHTFYEGPRKTTKTVIEEASNFLFPSPPAEFQQEGLYRLTDIAEKTGLSSQYIINLIERYGLVNPPRDAQYGSRQVYDLRAADVEKIYKVAHLKELGYQIKEIIDLIEHEEIYRKIGKCLSIALHEWYQHRSKEAWEKVVQALAETPSLNQKERIVLTMRHLGCNLVDCASEANLRSESHARKMLQSAYNKIGCAIFFLIGAGTNR